MVGFKEDEYLLRQSLLTSDHLDTPMVRTGPPKGTDVVRWKVTDNVHRGANHPQALIKPNPKEISEHFIQWALGQGNIQVQTSACSSNMVTSSLPLVQYPVSLRLNRKFSENLSRRESKDAEQLRKDVVDNVSVWLFVGGHLHYSKSATDHCVSTVFYLQSSSMRCTSIFLGPRRYKILHSGKIHSVTLCAFYLEVTK